MAMNFNTPTNFVYKKECLDAEVVANQSDCKNHLSYTSALLSYLDLLKFVHLSSLQEHR